jgi:hypothetical protein
MAEHRCSAPTASSSPSIVPGPWLCLCGAYWEPKWRGCRLYWVSGNADPTTGGAND